MSPDGKQTLRLVTINTWKCDGAYHRRLDHLERSLRRLRPDVICCQGVFQSPDIQYLTHHPDLAVIDAAGRSHAKASMVTFPASGTLPDVDAQPVGKRKRIDYVFCLGQSTSDRPKIEDARVVLDQPSPEGVFASDHYGVLIDAILRHRND
jgi:endonuclease/exonuclease/phosphatase family metal-dependent hydrolase